MIAPHRETVPLGQTDTPAGCMAGGRRRETELEKKWSISSCGSLLVVNSSSELPRLPNLRQVEQ